MKIELRTVKVRDLIADYKDAQEKGVTAWGGLLDLGATGRKAFSAWRHDTKDDALLQSGLLGPVTLSR